MSRNNDFDISSVIDYNYINIKFPDFASANRGSSVLHLSEIGINF